MLTTIDLMGFVHELREEFFERAAKLGWKAFAQDRGVSMGSFRDIFLHLAYVEEQHVTKFCEDRATVWMPEVMRIPKDRFRSLAAVRRRLREVRAMGDRRFPRWNTPRELDRPAVWVAARKYPIRLTRDAAMAQCVTEHLLHLGEVEAMLWQLDIEPPTTFWIDRRVLHGKWPPPKRSLYVGRPLITASVPGGPGGPTASVRRHGRRDGPPPGPRAGRPRRRAS